uniref:Uncharacterized protein n=1 Tax=Arundo donax TaxID=35708 RepID=A0A0A9HSJ2_ARUDO
MHGTLRTETTCCHDGLFFSFLFPCHGGMEHKRSALADRVVACPSDRRFSQLRRDFGDADARAHVNTILNYKLIDI